MKNPFLRSGNPNTTSSIARIKKTTDLESSWKTIKKSKSTTLNLANHTLKPSINSLLSPMKNLLLSIFPLINKNPTKFQKKSKKKHLMDQMLIGLPMELLVQLKIKDLVVPPMPFQQLVLLKVYLPLFIKVKPKSQFNKSLIVLHLTETMDAQLAEWTTASNTSVIRVILMIIIGINSWASYPYNGRQGACGVTGGSFRIKSYNTVKDCNNLATALISEPVSVAVDGRNFQFYKSGIFSNCSTNLTLAVLLVGMTDNYWTLKNSWGTTWGEAGYIRISRGNTCGVCNDCSYPV